MRRPLKLRFLTPKTQQLAQSSIPVPTNGDDSTNHRRRTALPGRAINRRHCHHGRRSFKINTGKIIRMWRSRRFIVSSRQPRAVHPRPTPLYLRRSPNLYSDPHRISSCVGLLSQSYGRVSNLMGLFCPISLSPSFNSFFEDTAVAPHILNYSKPEPASELLCRSLPLWRKVELFISIPCRHSWNPRLKLSNPEILLFAYSFQIIYYCLTPAKVPSY